MGETYLKQKIDEYLCSWKEDPKYKFIVWNG